LDGFCLATASEDKNIYLYRSEDKRTFHRHGVCRGHSGSIKHLDFSSNSMYIQSNCSDSLLLFWDMRGNPIKSAASLKDVTWATITCVYCWSMLGLGNKNNYENKINTCMVLTDIGDIVVGDNNNLVKLFRYPALAEGS
jgi:microtubule-associated protein-like 6